MGTVEGKFSDAIKSFEDAVSKVFPVKGDGGSGLEMMFNAIVDTIKDLPQKFVNIITIIGETTQEILNFAGDFFAKRFLLIISRVRNYVEAIQAAVMEIYNAVVDSVTVELPWIAKTIGTALESLYTGLGNLFKVSFCSRYLIIP